MERHDGSRNVGSATHIARISTAGVAYLFALGGLAQVFLVGLSAFESATYWTEHVDLGRWLGIPALLLPLVALAGRIGRRRTLMALAVTLLYMLQMTLANIDNGFIAAFHALNAFLLIGTAAQVGAQTMPLLRSGRGTRGTIGAPQGATD